MDASNALGLELQRAVSDALAGRASPTNPHGRQFTPEETLRAINAAHHTWSETVGDDSFNLSASVTGT